MVIRQCIGAAIVAILFFLGGLFFRDYGQSALWLGAAVLIYFYLFKTDPESARVWLCLGVAVIGGFLLAGAGLSFIDLFRNGYNTLGLVFIAAPVLFVVGGFGGFYLAYRWTEPL